MTRSLAAGEHPSHLELDRLMLGAARSAGTAVHVSACARCRDHLDGLRLEAASPPPAGLRERIQAGPALAPKRAGMLDRAFAGWRARWPVGVAGAAGLAAAVAVAVMTVRADLWPPDRSHQPDSAEPAGQQQPAPVYVASKGLPSVWIYVKRGEDLTLWDGQRSLEPGDRFRIKVDPQGHTYAQVFSREAPDAALVPIYGDRVPGDAVTTLPAAWQLDRRSGRDSLVVVLAARAITAAEVRRFVEQGPPPDVWLRQFDLRPVAPAAPEKARPR
jgi:hypothetical protein